MRAVPRHQRRRRPWQRPDSGGAEPRGRYVGPRLERRRNLRQHQERRAAGLQHGAVEGSVEGQRHVERRQLHPFDREKEVKIKKGGTEIPPFLPFPPFRPYFDVGSGRTWNFTSLLVLPLPPSAWNGARVA